MVYNKDKYYRREIILIGEIASKYISLQKYFLKMKSMIAIFYDFTIITKQISIVL